MPLVEAMRYGLPVLASDIAVFHEIGADYPNYFDPHDPHALREAISRFEDVTAGSGPRSIVRSTQHWLSWADSARMLLERVTAKVAS